MLTHTQLVRITLIQSFFLVGLLTHRLSQRMTSTTEQTSSKELSSPEQLAPLGNTASFPAPNSKEQFLKEINEIKYDLYQPLIELEENNLPSDALFEAVLKEGNLSGPAAQAWEKAVIALYKKHKIIYPGLPGEENIVDINEWLSISIHRIAKINPEGLPTRAQIEKATEQEYKLYISQLQERAQELEIAIPPPPHFEHKTLEEPMLVRAYLMGQTRKLNVEAKKQNKEDLLSQCLPSESAKEQAISSGALHTPSSTNVLKKLEECHNVLNITYTPPNSP